jgi:hypothetical protein
LWIFRIGVHGDAMRANTYANLFLVTRPEIAFSWHQGTRPENQTRRINVCLQAFDESTISTEII